MNFAGTDSNAHESGAPRRTDFSTIAMYAFGGLFLVMGFPWVPIGLSRFISTGDLGGVFATLAGLMFSGGGVAFIACVRYANKREKEHDSLKTQHPDEPWTWSKDWSNNRITSSCKLTAITIAVLATLWNLLTWGFLALFLRDEFHGTRMEWLTTMAVISLFPLIGLGLAGWAIVLARRYFTYGESVFQMSSVPGVIGGPFSGVIRTKTKLAPQWGYKLHLKCIRRTTQGAGKNRSTTETLVWDDTRVMKSDIGQGDAETAIPVLFHVPFDLKQSGDVDGRGRISWQLTATADGTRSGYNASFEVPVFRTAESSPAYVGDDSAIVDHLRTPNPHEACTEAGIARHQTPGSGLIYTFGMLRDLQQAALGLFVLLFLTAMFGAIGNLVMSDDSPVKDMWLVWKVGVGLFLLLFVYIGIFSALHTLGLWFEWSRVAATKNELTVRRGPLGIGFLKRIPANEIAAITCKRNLHGGQAGTHAFNCHLIAQTQNGKSIILGKHIKGKDVATTIIDDIQSALGIADDSIAPQETDCEDSKQEVLVPNC